MASSLVIGRRMVRTEELDERMALGQLRTFVHSAAKEEVVVLETTAGSVPSSDVPALSTVPGFTPIDLGKPLRIEIQTIYTGDAPRTGLFGWGGQADLLVSSAVRAYQTHGKAPRAINQILKAPEDRVHRLPSAGEDGSPIVYYTPALVNSQTLCSFHMIADSFPEEMVNGVAELFGKAAGLPLFAPAASYLMVGSSLLRIFGDLGKALFESDPFLTADLNLRFDVPGVPEALATHAVLYNDSDKAEFDGLQVKFEGDALTGKLKLVDGQGREYQGNAPYLIALLDGGSRDELSDFSPKLASAALIEKFYGSGDATGATLDVMESALKLYNDYQFRQKAEAAKKKLVGDVNSKEYKQAKKLFDAYNSNITEDAFKVSVG